MSLTTRVSLICLCAFAYPAVSFGALTPSNDTTLPASGDGNNITSDSATGLDWLDPDATLGRTVADILLEIDKGATGSLPGMRYADEDQIYELFLSQGIPVDNWPGTSRGDGIAEANALMAIIGDTGEAGPLRLVAGFTGVSSGGNFNFAELATDTFFPSSPETVTFLKPSTATSTPTRGHWLVRDQLVPEPSSILIWGSLGLAVGLAGRRRNRRNRVG